jgi:hypothetical protein
MTRLIRMIIPVSLGGLITSAIILACSHRGEAPATPRPEPTSPSGQPAPLPLASGEGNGMAGAGTDRDPPRPGGSQAALDRGPDGRGAPAGLLAAQPVMPPGPTGAPPTPGAPAPNPPTPSPNAPAPTPSLPRPGTPTTPGLPPSPTGPSQPGGPTTPPGGTPTQTPGDAGTGDALTPPVPPISDAGVRIDSGMSPILQRDR